MADETRTAEVQLNADVSGYTQGMSEAYEKTNGLVNSVNKLSASLDGITKKLGKKILLFSAADTAAVAGMVALTAKYEKQLSTLAAQQAIGNKQLTVYKSGITDLSKELPKSRGELAQLVTQINQLGVTSEREALKMAKVFTNLSAATGDDISALTQGMIELGRAMGTLGGGAGMMENFSDSLTKVSNYAGVAATSVVNFANSISPFARSAGIGEAALLGISAAFTKAGADGYAAANTFNTIVSDITRQLQNGSPEIAKYASAIGVTAEQFKKMDMTERITQIFEAVNKAGPGGIRIMDQLGQDGIRAARAIQQVSNQAGGLREAVNISLEAYGGGATQTGATAAFDTLDSKVTLLKNQMEAMGSAIGDAVLPPLKSALDILNRMATNAMAFLEPLLKAAGLMGAILAPFAAAAGTLSTLLGPLSTLMMGFMLFRLSPMRSLLAGLGEGARIGGGGEATPAPAPGAKPANFNQKAALWRAEQTAAAAQGRLPNEQLRVPNYQMKMYDLGQKIGGSVPGVAAARLVPASVSTAATLGLRGVGAIAEGTRQWARDASLKNWWERQSIGRGIENWARERGIGSAPEGYGLRDRMRAFGTITRDAWAERGSGGAGFGKTFSSEMEKYNKQMAAAATAQAVNTSATAGNTASTTSNTAAQTSHTMTLSQRIKAELASAQAAGAFTAALKRATYQTFIGYPASMAKFGWNAGSQIVGGVGKGIGSLLGTVGGLVGGGAATGGALVGVGLAGWYAKQSAEKLHEATITKDSLTNLGPTNIALGQATQQLKNFALQATVSTREIKTFADAATVTHEEKVGLSQRGVKDKRVENLTTNEQIIAFLKSMGKMTPEQYHSLVLDITNVVGSQRTKDITTKYSQDTANGADPYRANFLEISGPLMDSAASKNQAGVVGAARRLPFFVNPFANLAANFSVDSSAQEDLNAVWSAIPERSLNQETLYNVDAGKISESLDVYRAMQGAYATGDKTTQLEAFGNFEHMYNGGKDLGVNTGLPFGPSFTEINGMKAEDVKGFYAALWNPENEATAAWRASQEEVGLTAEDYQTGGKALEEKLLKAQYKVPTDVETQLRGTSLGSITLDSDTVKKVTTGTEVANPTNTRAAIDEMTKAAFENAKAGESVTSAFQDLSNNAGAASSYLYQLAQAAMLEAQNAEMYKAKSGGWMKEFTTRWSQINDQLADPAIQKDEKDKLREERRAMKEDLRQRYAQNVLAEKQYALQRDRSQADFDKQMRRSIEQAAASWSNAYERTSNQQQITSSPGLVGLNMAESVETVQGQLAALKKLKAMGLSDQAIASMNLADPNMGNQAIRMAEQANKGDVQAFNDLAKQREEAVDELTKKFSRPFKQAEADFTLAADRAKEDMLLVGQIAIGTIKELHKEANALAEKYGLVGMAALEQNNDVYETSKKDSRRAQKLAAHNKGVNDSEDYWTMYLDDVVDETPSKGGPKKGQGGTGTATTDGFNEKAADWVNNSFLAKWNRDLVNGANEFFPAEDAARWFNQSAFGAGSNAGANALNNSPVGVASTTAANAINDSNIFTDAANWINNAVANLPWAQKDDANRGRTSGSDTPVPAAPGNGTTTLTTINRFELSGDIIAPDPAALIGELRRRAALNNLKTGGQGQAIPAGSL